MISPRSLEACDALGIEPWELLRKTRDDIAAQYPEVKEEELSYAFNYADNKRLKKIEDVKEVSSKNLSPISPTSLGETQDHI